MSSSSYAHTPAADRARPWLYGPRCDLFLGYGLAYLLSVPLLLMLTGRSGAGERSLWVTTVLVLFFSTPHYGATLLRVYENRKERRAYAFFTVWASAVLFGLFVLGLHSPWVGSILLTAYVVWGIWHFSAQNYGIAVMYLRRRDLDVTPDIKKPLYASFVLSAALAVIAIYVVGSQLSFAAVSHDYSGTFRILQVGIPQPFRGVVDVVAAAGYLGSLGLVAFRLRGRLPVRQLAPVGLLVLTQALWYVVPSIGAIAGVWSSTTMGYAFAAIWISTAHAVQYLWVSTYYAQRAGRCGRLGPYLFKCLLAGAAITSPGLFLAPGLFGGAAIEGPAIVVLVFAMVNLHHFVIDGAIWKLTDGRVARLLIRSQADEPVAQAPAGWGWMRAAAFGVGALVVAQQLYGAWAVRVMFTEEASLWEKHTAAHELHWLGLDLPDVWLKLGQRAEEEGQPGVALDSYRRGVEMYAQGPPPWVMSRMAWLLLEQGSDPEAVEMATEVAVYLTRMLGDTHPEGYHTLAAAHAAGRRWPEAIEAAKSALAVSRAIGDLGRARVLERALAQYRARAAAQSARLGSP